MWSVDWDGDFVVGGDGNTRLTPAFRLKEFRDRGRQGAGRIASWSPRCSCCATASAGRSR